MKEMQIEETISLYLKMEKPVSDFTIRCFVGMVQTGEATLQDFKVNAGNEVVNRMEDVLCK